MTEITLSQYRSEHELARVSKFLKECFPGKRVEVVVRRKVRERTSPQCRYLNGVAYKLLSEATGYERDEISEYMCGTYWGWRQEKCPKTPSNPEGVRDRPIRTTTTDEEGKRDVLPWDKFGDYVAFIQRFAAKRGIFIPDPDPEWLLKEEAA